MAKTKAPPAVTILEKARLLRKPCNGPRIATAMLDIHLMLAFLKKIFELGPSAAPSITALPSPQAGSACCGDRAIVGFETRP